MKSFGSCIIFAVVVVLSTLCSSQRVEAVSLRDFDELCAVNSLYLAGKLLDSNIGSYVEVYNSFPGSKARESRYYSLADIDKVANELGFTARVRKINLRELNEMERSVAVVFTEPDEGEIVGHFVCMRAHPRGEGIQIIDPPNFPITLSGEFSDDRYMAVVLSENLDWHTLSTYEKFGGLALLVCLVFFISFMVKRRA